MKKLRITLLALLFYGVTASYSQTDAYDCVATYLKQHTNTADSTNLAQVLTQSIDLPKAGFYLMAELHGVNATPIVQLALIKKLSAASGLKYVILEMSHSNAFLMNKYLETGDAAYFKSLTDARRCRWLLDSLIILNRSLQPQQQIRFIGIDMEYNNISVYRKAMEILLDVLKQKTGEDRLLSVLQDATREQSERKYVKLNEEIKGLLKGQPKKYQDWLGGNYADLLMITSNQFNDNGMRDDEMFLNFSNNVHNVFQLQQDEPFFASFGATHATIMIEKRFIHFITDYYKQREQEIFLIGTQYLNCYSVNGTVKISNDGSIAAYGKYASKHSRLLQSLKDSWEEKEGSFAIIDLKSFSCENTYPVNLLQKPQLMIMCRNFGPLEKGR